MAVSVFQVGLSQQNLGSLRKEGEKGPGHTVIHTKQVINGFNLPAEPGQGW